MVLEERWIADLWGEREKRGKRGKREREREYKYNVL